VFTITPYFLHFIFPLLLLAYNRVALCILSDDSALKIGRFFGRRHVGAIAVKVMLLLSIHEPNSHWCVLTLVEFTITPENNTEACLNS
jgi:hypothetical protein